VNLIKAALPGYDWIYHHDDVNLQVHNIAKQSGMTNDMEIENYFIRRLREGAI